jgi:Fe-S-cluster containining protein
LNTIRDVHITTDCESCTTKCCSQPYDWVYLTSGEIKRLSAVSGLAPRAFVSEQVNANTGHRFRVLTLPCPFLDGSGKCTVYEQRPLICRTFPLYPEPLTGNACLLPAQCGVHLKVLQEKHTGSWTLGDFESEMRQWLRELWFEATAV